MDRALIAEKLESLRRCVQRIGEKCPPSAERLAADYDLQDIVALNLTRAVQLCVDIGAHIIADRDVPPPETMGAAFDALVQIDLLDPELGRRLKSAVGFRNIAVHNYQAIDWAIVHAICRSSVSDFTAFAKRVAEVLE